MKESSFPVAVGACLQASSQRKKAEQEDLEDLVFWLDSWDKAQELHWYLSAVVPGQPCCPLMGLTALENLCVRKLIAFVPLIIKLHIAPAALLAAGGVVEGQLLVWLLLAEVG